MPLLHALLLCLSFGVFARAAQPAPADAEKVPAVAVPDTPVGRQLGWVMSVLNGGDVGPLEGRFTPEMLEQFTAARIQSSLLEIRDDDLGGPPITLVEIEGNATDHAISGFVFGPRRKMNVFVAVDDVSGLISGLRFSRAGYLFRRAGDWDAYQGDLGRRVGQLTFGAYEIIDIPPTAATVNTPATPETSRLSPIHTIDDDKALNIATASRVFILASLVEHIEQGACAWTDKLAVKDSLKSLPPGIMQGFKEGDEYALSFFADRMMAIVDHTAADHLLAHLGRGSVESVFKRYVEEPAKTLPFLSTAESFRLRLPEDHELLESYAQDDEAARREILDPEKGPLAKVHLADLDENSWTGPVELTDVGWFASAHDIARVLADLRLASRRATHADSKDTHAPEPANGQTEPTSQQPVQPDPLFACLSRHTPFRLDRNLWPGVWYVGGGEPGALSMNFLLTRDDGKSFILCVTWNDPDDPLEEGRLVELANVGLDLLAKASRDPAAQEPSEPASP